MTMSIRISWHLFRHVNRLGSSNVLNRTWARSRSRSCLGERNKPVVVPTSQSWKRTWTLWARQAIIPRYENTHTHTIKDGQSSRLEIMPQLVYSHWHHFLSTHRLHEQSCLWKEKRCHRWRKEEPLQPTEFIGLCLFALKSLDVQQSIWCGRTHVELTWQDRMAACSATCQDPTTRTSMEEEDNDDEIQMRELMSWCMNM